MFPGVMDGYIVWNRAGCCRFSRPSSGAQVIAEPLGWRVILFGQRKPDTLMSVGQDELNLD